MIWIFNIEWRGDDKLGVDNNVYYMEHLRVNIVVPSELTSCAFVTHIIQLLKFHLV